MKPKHILILSLNAASVLFFFLMTLMASVTANSLADQHAAERWAGNRNYAQISVYTDEFSAYGINGIFTARVDIEKKLVENSFAPERKNSRIWADAFSTSQMKAVVSSDRTSSEVNMIVTGGDFFLFHPQDMLYGYYYSDDDTMHDRIVIDDVLAWQLYGASNIVGKPVTINGKYYHIAGVFRQSSNSDTRKVYEEKPRIFMPYQGYSILGETPLFSCYEACLPNPVTGLAKNIVSESISISEENYRIVENSDRYSLKNRFVMLRDSNTRSVVDIPVVYPYWENAARITEDRSVLLLAMQIIGAVIPIFTVIWLLRKLVKNRKKLAKKISEKIFDKTKELLSRRRRISPKTSGSSETEKSAVEV